VVGLVIVSHSTAIAAGVKALADQMAQGRVQIAAAGGTLEGELGTSVDHIRSAVEQVASPEGVLILVDLGSAVLSAETAIEGLNVRCLISNAPLVEGAVLASVEASVGAGLEQANTAAEAACTMVKVQR
jgi:phosphoenolpyruvate---glycerone phosphotransferase subunit DhaM